MSDEEPEPVLTPEGCTPLGPLVIGATASVVLGYRMLREPENRVDWATWGGVILFGFFLYVVIGWVVWIRWRRVQQYRSRR